MRHRPRTRPEDIGLPYMLDPRHPSDTLFFVAECDYRFYRADAEARVMQPPWTTEGLQRDLWELRRQGREESGGGALCPLEGFARPVPKIRPSSGSSQVRPTSMNPFQLREAAAEPADWGSDSPRVEDSPEESATELAPTERASSEDEAAEAESAADLGGWRRRPPNSEPSQELVDLVGICNRAAKAGLGNIVWLAWEPATSKRGFRQQPVHGTTLVAFTQQGAQAFKEHLSRQEPQHLDVILAHWLIEPGVSDTVKASFLYPTAGSYVCHVSGCEKNLVRESSFGKKHVGDGVRAGEARWICGYQAKGGARYVEQLNLDAHGLDWVTERPPYDWWSPEYSFMLKDRGWVDSEGNWVGPYWKAEAQEEWEGGARPSRWAEASAARNSDGPSPAPGEHVWRSGHRGQKARTSRRAYPKDSTWRELCSNPDGRRWLGGPHGYSPLTRLQEQLVCDPLNFGTVINGWPSARISRLRRRALQFYKMRIFGPREEAAASPDKCPCLRPSELPASICHSPFSPSLIHPCSGHSVALLPSSIAGTKKKGARRLASAAAVRQ